MYDLSLCALRTFTTGRVLSRQISFSLFLPSWKRKFIRFPPIATLRAPEHYSGQSILRASDLVSFPLGAARSGGRVLDALERATGQPHVLRDDPPRHGAAQGDKDKDDRRKVEVLGSDRELEGREERSEEVNCRRRWRMSFRNLNVLHDRKWTHG